MSTTAPVVPVAPFVGLDTLWIQLSGTWCNLECTHCLNASGPRAPWLRPLDAGVVRHAIDEAAALGVKELYVTGGEPFLHPDVLPLLERALTVAPTSVLTNGTRVTERVADALAALAARAAYSLEVRVSLDAVDEAENDAIRGRGAWAGAVRAITRLAARGLLPIVTATDVLARESAAAGRRSERFRDFLRAAGIRKPRVKIMPVFPVGRREGRAVARLTDETLEGFDRTVLQCAGARVIADGGVYACPILAGLPGARRSAGSLRASFRETPLSHPACVTCVETGMSCRND